MKARFGELLVLIVGMGISLFPSGAEAGTSEGSRKALTQLLLGKEVKPLLQLPATKEGIDVYYSRKGGRIDERGLDLEDMTKWLKERGVGVEANQPVPITEVRIGGDKIEVHLAGAGKVAGEASTRTIRRRAISAPEARASTSAMAAA